MAATARIDFFHGAGGTASEDVSTVRYKRADNDTADYNNPIQLPTSGTNYSWSKYCKLYFTGTPVGQISNLSWSMSGTPATGLTLYVKKIATYTQPASADEAGQISGTANATAYTSGSPLSITAGEVLANPSVGYGNQDYCLTQLAVSDTALHGVSSAVTCIYSWEEI